MENKILEIGGVYRCVYRGNDHYKFYILVKDEYKKGDSGWNGAYLDATNDPVWYPQGTIFMCHNYDFIPVSPDIEAWVRMCHEKKQIVSYEDSQPKCENYSIF